MIITCPKCETKYRYDERRFDGEAVKHVKCTSCGFTFDAANPSLAAPPAAPAVLDDVDIPPAPAPSLEPAAVETPVPLAPAPAAGEEDDPIPALPTDPRYSLAVIAGGQAGSVFQIHKPRILIGRGSAMDIQLRDSEVSRRHAKLEIRDPVVTLTDLETTNGTWFDGSKIGATELNHQDEFTVGSTTLMLIVTPVQGSH